MKARGQAQLATAEIHPSGFLDYRLYLDALYQWTKSRGDTYSYQKFAADLGFGATTVMHQIIKGHRPLTLKAAATVVKHLGLKKVERRYFLALVEYCNTNVAARRDALFESMLVMRQQELPTKLEQDALTYFSEWYHPVVRELVATPEFQSNPEWISSAISPNITPTEAAASLSLLERLGQIVFDVDRQRYVQTQKRVSTGPRVKNMALTSYHKKMIDLGKEALVRLPGTRRDISAMTVAVSEEGMQRLKDMIHAFQTQMLDAADNNSGSEIVQVNIQLFPFTTKRGGD